MKALVLSEDGEAALVAEYDVDSDREYILEIDTSQLEVTRVVVARTGRIAAGPEEERAGAEIAQRAPSLWRQTEGGGWASNSWASRAGAAA